MLAPLRDYIRPKDPTTSLLLNTTKQCYFSQLSTYVHPDHPGFEASRWITSEDVNVEHLLDVFTSIAASSKDVWDACIGFMCHIHWHKPRLVMLGPKIEEIPDDYPFKANCLSNLSLLFFKVGNLVESRRLVTHAIKLWRHRGDDCRVAHSLNTLSNTSRTMGLYKEGIQEAQEGSEIFERLGYTADQATCLLNLASALRDDNQLDAAEEAASRAIDLFPEKGQEYRVCVGHRILGEIYQFKGDVEKAIHHFETTLGIASSLNLDSELFWVHLSLARLFLSDHRLDDTQVHIECAKSHTANNAFNLGCAMELQARVWGGQGMFEKARAEAAHAAEIFEKLGAAQALEACRQLLQMIDKDMNNPVIPYESGE